MNKNNLFSHISLGKTYLMNIFGFFRQPLNVFWRKTAWIKPFNAKNAKIAGKGNISNVLFLNYWHLDQKENNEKGNFTCISVQRKQRCHIMPISCIFFFRTKISHFHWIKHDTWLPDTRISLCPSGENLIFGNVADASPTHLDIS